MSNLTQVIESVKSELEVDSNGHGKASIRAVSTLAGVDHESIRKALKSGRDLEPSKLAQMLIQQGFSGGDLNGWRTDGIPDRGIATILEYYAFDAGRYCTLQARLVYRSFSAIGIRAWIQDKLGWNQDDQLQEALKTMTMLEQTRR